VGARLIKKRGAANNTARRKEEFRAIVMIICAIVLPLVLAFILVAADMRSDLSDLIPREALPDQSAALIGWADLEIPEGRSVSLEQRRWQPKRRVRMLGYAMDGYTVDGHKPARDGASVEMFVLLPEAGQILHPAHRIPDQMVEIWPAHPTQFKFRSLVWATGVLARKQGRREADKALYAMTDSEVKPAAQSDITLWFKP
jgi:hypothetical protein